MVSLMRKGVVGLSLFLSLSLIPAYSATPPKAGTSCAKQGITKTYKGKTFKCKKAKGKLVWNKGKVAKQAAPVPGATQSPYSTPAPSPSATPSTTPTPTSIAAFVESSRVADVDECRLKDARKNKQQPNNSGFPLSPDIIPPTGVARYIAIPIDFSDAPGSAEFFKKLRQQEEEFRKWFGFFSSGSLKIEWLTTDKWIRASKPSSEYSTSKGAANAPNPYGAEWNAYAQEFIDLSGNLFNWNGVHGVFFHFSDNQKTKISSELLGRGVELNTPQGKKQLFFWASGNYAYEEERRVRNYLPNYWAALWVHEVLHSMGISLHAPGNGFQTGVGQNQASRSWVLTAWETFKLGWYQDEQVFCAPKSKVNDLIVKLRPIEQEGSGNKVTIVPLNATQALVVESRRPVGYSEAWPKSNSGIYVYRLDTTLDNDRTNESTGKDSGNDPKYQKWGFYLASDQRPNISIRPHADIYLDYIIFKGESVTYDGIRIHLLDSNELDVIKISRT
jgi:M6 family metalloprotease-like protein